MFNGSPPRTDAANKYMSASPQRNGSGPSQPDTWPIPPAMDWRRETYRLFLNRLSLPLLGLALVFAGVGAAAFVILAFPQHATRLYPLLVLLVLAAAAPPKKALSAPTAEPAPPPNCWPRRC